MALDPKDRTTPQLTQALPGQEVLRPMLQELVQAALEEEFNQFIGAGPWRRSEQRRGWRNGSKPRQWRTRVGTLDLLVPKDREGRFQPSLFARYERSEKALVLALIEMYVKGVSTRKVSDIVEQLCGLSVSASQVSVLVRNLDTELATWRERSLAEQAYPYLTVDAHYEKVRRDGRIRATAVLWVIGVRADGYREHLGVWLGDAESAETWGQVFGKLLERGLRGVRYIVSDEHRGLREALARYLPGAAHQRCQVHYLRNVMAQAPSPERFHEAKDGLRQAWDAATREAADQHIAALLGRLEKSSPRLARYLEESVEETLVCFELPTVAERTRLRTTNAVEHDHAEVRRRTRVVRIFPNDASLLRLTSALAVDRNEQWATRRYLAISEEDRLWRAWSRFRHSA